MKKLVLALCCLFLFVPFTASAHDRPLLVVSESIEINAKPDEVWKLVKRFNGLQDWHPAFARSVVVKGRDGVPGAIREVTVKDGPTFTEELLAVNNEGMAIHYNVIESPLPLDGYLSTMGVRPSASGGSIVSWNSTFMRKNPRDNVPEAESDAGAVKFITGAYQAGLQNLKKVLEGK